jgi:hypothetical protein
MNEERIVPVAMGVLQRIKRKLRHDDRRLRTARGWFSDLGLCVPKIRFCSIGGKGHQGQVVM